MIELFQEQAADLIPEDLQWIVPELILSYKEKLRKIAWEVYGESELGLASLNKQAVEVVNRAAYTYFFTSKLWANQRSLNTYILTSLNWFKSSLLSQQNATQKHSVPICPACGEEVAYEGKLLRCYQCSKKIEQSGVSILELHLAKTFALHTYKGYRCAQCYHFIPDSAKGKFGITCPFDDCDFSDKVENLVPIVHPVRIKALKRTGLDNGNVEAKVATVNFQQTEFLINENLDFDKYLKIIQDIINNQIITANYSCQNLGLLKSLSMYQAFSDLLTSNSQDMLEYLIYNRLPDYSIYAKIFQQFILKLEERLPYNYQIEGSSRSIHHLLDKDLGIFLGQSEYSAEVQEGGIINNNTKEIYISSKNFKNYGRCFIGKLISVFDDVGNEVVAKGHDFSKIYTDLTKGEMVHIIHYRIPAHWDVGGLTTLGKIRRSIIKSIKKRIN